MPDINLDFTEIFEGIDDEELKNARARHVYDTAKKQVIEEGNDDDR